MRVAMTTARYDPLVGGVETHTREVGRRLAAAGTAVDVLTLDPGTGAPALERHGALTVHRFPGRPKAEGLALSPALVRAVAGGGYDLVHVQGVHTLLCPEVLLAAERRRIPSVVTLHTGGHSSRLRTRLRAVQWRALGPLLRRAGGLVAVCHYEHELFTRLLGVPASRIRVIPNGADPLPVGEGRAPVTGRPLVASIGRLERYKGHHRVLAALPHLLARHPDAHLAVVGSGPDERHLRALVARLGVGGAVSFVSFDAGERAGMGRLVAAADVVTLMSEYEAHPLAVLEALGLGRKVVVADTSGLSELGRHELVTVVPLGLEPAALARVLVRVAELPAGPAPALPDWDDCAEALAAYYRDVLGYCQT